MTKTTNVHGYYRFTDIIFEWSQALPHIDEWSPLKALLSFNALVSPDHPLRKEGVDGIELYLGTFANGEMRLLFSSAQVEYMRYWLHAMQLTPRSIPIPSSDVLLQAGDFMTCSTVVYNNPDTLKRAVKTIDKNNRKLKNATLLTARRLAFEKIRTLWAARAGTWMALDFEAWDHDHTLLTEFGWSLVRFEGGTELAESGHLVVKEHRGYFNTYVTWPDRRDFYNFGKSEDVDKRTFKQRIRDLIAEHCAKGPLFLIFHDNSQDIKYLRSKMVQAISHVEFLLPDTMPADGTYVVDTSDMFSALEGNDTVDRRGLERMCHILQLEPKNMHNAGNDAHYTLLAFREMASGDPVDVQREKRWPNRTSTHNPKVEFTRKEEGSDVSDLEGIFPGGADSDDDDDDDFGDAPHANQVVAN
ncbi:hypothetical protein CERSUDRAFT_111333 [Gelatoporia subvermispora B]|uniref:Gfd2/YDR514C-like C-terminal domain-containing protein n=1 Tax=Ceriporiopsis subvermispora (strain B) TaxID=914234 RepID=M2PVF9_CERS8|nr:hypothetical protein CERSUDRAFT_111333 [Gelatoporia subvermispora B]